MTGLTEINQDSLLYALKSYSTTMPEYRIDDAYYQLRQYWESWYKGHHEPSQFKFYLFVLFMIMNDGIIITDSLNSKCFLYEIPFSKVDFNDTTIPPIVSDIIKNKKFYCSMIYVLEYIQINTKFYMDSIPLSILLDLKESIFPFALSCYYDNDPLYSHYELEFSGLLADVNSDILFD